MLPYNVKLIIDKLESQGYEAYAVGGCVRDSLLLREPEDWDITTSATPLETKALFKRTIDTGLQHGTVTVLLKGGSYEVTTYRIDGEYVDNRHPSEVTYTLNLVEDLKRRDFTINAMAYNDRSGIVDHFCGKEDLERGIIRCVGDANQRFSEDALRILRAIRFSAQLGFVIEENTRAAIKALAVNLQRISAERIQTEIVKLLVSDHPDYLRDAWELGITHVILPEFDDMMETTQHNPHHCFSVGEHTLEALKHIEADRVLRLAMLLHDIGKPATKTTDAEGKDHFYGHPETGEQIARTILRRLKFDNDTTHKVLRLIKYHDQHPALHPRSVRKMIYRVGEDLFPSLLKIQRADIMAQSHYQQREKLADLAETERLYHQILEARDCLSIKDLAISGKDLIADGLSPGPQIGKVLSQLLSEVLEEPKRNTKEYLLAQARQMR